MKTINNMYDSIPRRIILELHNSPDNIYASKIFKKLDVGQHIKTITFLKNQNIIESHKQGRIKIIELTEKGHKLGKHFNAIEKILLKNE